MIRCLSQQKPFKEMVLPLGCKKLQHNRSRMLLTVHWSEFISVFNQLDAQNLFHNKFISCLYMFRAHAHHQEVKIALHSLWYHHTYKWLSRARVERGQMYGQQNIKIGVNVTAFDCWAITVVVITGVCSWNDSCYYASYSPLYTLVNF